MALTEEEFWALIHTERARIGDLLEGLDDAAWKHETLCSNWTVRDVVAHLTAAASTTKWAWFRSILSARFNVANHNQRFVEKYLGSDASDTLGQYQRSISNKITPSKDYQAWLAEVIIHGQDIAAPLDLPLKPDPQALSYVAPFLSSKNFAVNSKTLVDGLALIATDDEFKAGDGPDVRGPILDLVMAMAGRPEFAHNLIGEGADELRSRLIESTGESDPGSSDLGTQ